MSYSFIYIYIYTMYVYIHVHTLHMQAGTQTFEVEGVTSGSSAAQAGLREGLILEKLDRVKVTGWTQQKLDKT